MIACSAASRRSTIYAEIPLKECALTFIQCFKNPENHLHITSSAASSRREESGAFSSDRVRYEQNSSKESNCPLTNQLYRVIKCQWCVHSRLLLPRVADKSVIAGLIRILMVKYLLLIILKVIDYIIFLFTMNATKRALVNEPCYSSEDIYMCKTK